MENTDVEKGIVKPKTSDNEIIKRRVKKTNIFKRKSKNRKHIYEQPKIVNLTYFRTDINLVLKIY